MEHISKNIKSYEGHRGPSPQDVVSRYEPENEEQPVMPAYFSGKQTTYCIVYNGLTSRYDLTPIEILVLAMIIGLSKRNPCTASQLTFAGTFNVADPTARDAIRRLEAKGVIEKTGKISKYRTYELVLTKDASSYLKNLQTQIELKKKHNEEKRKRGKDSLYNNY